MPNSPLPLLSVVMPLYNEARDIESHVERVQQVLSEAHIPHEFVLVDDGSSDGSWLKIQGLCESLGHVHGIRLSRNFGKEAALCAGLDAAVGGAVVCLDADLQHPPELIPQMYATWREQEVHIVEAVKQERGDESWLYRLCAKTFYSLLNKLSGINLRNSSDFRLLDREAVEAWKRLPERQTFFRGMSAWIGFSRTQIPFQVAPRSHGQSKWPLSRLVRLALNAITSYSSVPLYISTVLGFVLILIFTVLMGQTLYMKFNGLAQDGFTTVILLQLIIGGSLMLAVGVIGLYVEKIYEEVKARPRYLIADSQMSEHSEQK